MATTGHERFKYYRCSWYSFLFVVDVIFTFLVHKQANKHVGHLRKLPVVFRTL